jgi:hypothetical protein
MYTGHFAIGLAIKARFPRVPTIPIMLGVGILDMINGIFTATGIDQVTPNPSSGPYLFFDLNWIDWDHSLLMAIIWSFAWGAVFIENKKVAVIAAVAVFSHFVVDWPVHNHDLAIYPYSAYHTGLGLWGYLGVGSWLLEGVFSAILLIYAWRESARRGVNILWPALLLAILFLQLSPWLSPMKIVACMSEPYTHIVHGALVTTGFLVPGLLMTFLIDRAEEV